MVIRWGEFSSKSSTALTTGWLITAGVVALYLGVIQPHHQAKREALPRRRASGLAAVNGGVGWEPPRSGDKLQFFRTSPKPTFKKAFLEAFPWTVPSSHPPLS
jgi:hypothetical protein